VTGAAATREGSDRRGVELRAAAGTCRDRRPPAEADGLRVQGVQT
jgi:hypothetical protein